MRSNKAAHGILSGLGEIAADYDGLVCDVWGVLHNGGQAYRPACEALQRFRELRGRVVLLSNAPRPVGDLEKQFERFGIPNDCYDAIVTSGAAARLDLEQRTRARTLAMYHLGPDRDRGVFEGLDIVCVEPDQAEVVLCTGLFDDESETPETYNALLRDLKTRGLHMLCANPDLVVQRAGKLVYCAGALARSFERLGGSVVYYGKPYRPIYDVTLAALPGAARVLAVGDGLATDIKGANAAGLDAVFIADGIHGERIEPFTAPHMAELLAEAGVSARATMRTLVW